METLPMCLVSSKYYHILNQDSIEPNEKKQKYRQEVKERLNFKKQDSTSPTLHKLVVCCLMINLN